MDDSSQLDPIVKDFLIESYENLDRLDSEFVALEKNPADRNLIASIFRTIHTIKGTTGFLGFSKLGSIAHVGENLLSRLREGELFLDSDIADGLLALVDGLRSVLSTIEATGKEGDADYTSLIENLTRLTKKEQVAKEGPPKIGEILVKSGQVSEEEVASALKQQESGDPRPIGEILADRGMVLSSSVTEALQSQGEASASAIAENTLRVDVRSLDKLMNLVGELVLNRNQILQFKLNKEEQAKGEAYQQLNAITTHLQEEVMKTRMQPINNLWNKLPRVVRDLASLCEKKVRFEMQGRDTELDKTILDAIKDPLTHLMRNAIDHGIEPPEKRVAAGKSPEGKLLLQAYHAGGKVNIEISDDGGGINVEKIRQKGIEKKMITAEQAAHLNPRELTQLIFRPGFSSADNITAISGRGVGMDVVKNNIEKIGGTVEVISEFGKGTTFKLTIPLTLAIIPTLIVTSGNEHYAIPEANLVELIRLKNAYSHKKIEHVHGAPVYRLRGGLIPLVFLNEELTRVKGLALEHTSKSKDEINLVVLQADNYKFGLVVDEINDTQEIVVKPLGQHLKGVSIFSGASVLGDRSIVLIIDVIGLAEQAGVISASSHPTMKVQSADLLGTSSETKEAVLLIGNGEDGRMAIPLSTVVRLEEFEPSVIEHVATQPVVQYREGILFLLNLPTAMHERRRMPRRPKRGGHPKNKKIEVVVCSLKNHLIGVIVQDILDIVYESLSVQKPATREGALFSSIIEDRVTEVLDIETLVRKVDPRFFD